MSTVTLNGRTIDRAADFTLLKNGELNWLLGVDGAPKYSDGAMKNKTKHALADELRDVVNSIPEARVKATNTGVGRGNSRQPTVSKTKAVAQSKKCNLLKALVAGKTTAEHIGEVLAIDTVLADYWKTWETDVKAAQNGIRPKSARAEVAQQVAEERAEDETLAVQEDVDDTEDAEDEEELEEVEA